MKGLRTIRRFISNAWLAAAPLVILLLLVGGLVVLGIVLGVVTAIVRSAYGPTAAENFLLGSVVWLAFLFALAMVGLIGYGLLCIARWLLSKEP